MQVKKFEAPTLQEALENVKRELGPEAIILQTRRNKSGFGLMSKASVEVTAAISDRSLTRKASVEKRFPHETAAKIKTLPATQQADFIDRTIQAYQERTQAKEAAPEARRLTATRYADIEDSAPSSAFTSGTAGTYTSQLALQQRAAHERLKAATISTSDSRTNPAPVNASYDGMVSQEASRTENSQLRGQIENLERMVQELKVNRSPSETAGPSLPRGLEEAMEFLLFAGIDRRQTYSIMKQVSFELGEAIDPSKDRALDEVAKILLGQIEVLDALEGIPTAEQRAEGAEPVMMALVGTCGAGKTATAAKIIQRAQSKNRLRVGLISYEWGAGVNAATSPLETYAKIMKVPFRRVVSKETMAVAMQEMKSLDFVLIDTPGVAQKNDAALGIIADALKQFASLRIELVVPAVVRDQELNDIAHRFSTRLQPEGLIFTKLDEAVMFGSIYNLSQKFKLPLFYFGTGQKIPEDLEGATAERLVALLLDLL